MKNKFLKLASLTWIVLTMSALILASSCKKDDEEDDQPPAAPIATFQFEVSDANPLEVTFENFSTNATSYSWDFGDSNTSTETNPTHVYADGGTYTVTLTATGAGGTADHSKDVTVIKPGGQNLIQNGEFDDDSVWDIIFHNTENTGTLEIAGGVATFNKGQTGDWGTGACHIGMNQAVTVEAGTYQMDLHITTNGINEVWFEVWVGPNAPVAGADYNEDNGATKVLSFNAWECPDNLVYTGQMIDATCQGTTGIIDLEAGTYYVVIRSGGITWGEDGIIIDNVIMK
jgi:PKD repeat protein